MRSYADQFTGDDRCTPAHPEGPGGREKLRPSMPLPSCCPMRLVQPVPLNPIHELGFPSIVSQDASVAEDACRNPAVPVPPSQPAVTFPRALGSDVQGTPEDKSAAGPWL